MRSWRTAGAAVLACLLACAARPVRADERWDWSAAVRASLLADERTPTPYGTDEFPPWVRSLRRAEIIFIGSVPFSMFFTFEAYDTYRFVASGLDPSYAPWPFRPGSTQQYSTNEKTWLVVSSLSASLLIAGVDWVIGRINEQHARR